MFTQKRVTTYSHLSTNKFVGYPNILQFFQDVATAHSASCGYGLDVLEEKGKAWILLSMRLSLQKDIPVSTPIAVSTWTTGFRHAYGFRSFQVKNENTDDIYASADSVWIFLDTKTGHPCRVPDEIMSLYGTEKSTDAIYIRREPDWKADTYVCDFRVLKRDLDSNHHMNNVKYTEYAMEALRDGDVVRGLEIFYKHPVYYGEKIYLYASHEHDCIYTNLKNDDDETCCYVKFII